MTIPPLPPGFVLEQPDQAQDSMPPLPPGFELIQDDGQADDGPGLEIDIVGGTPMSPEQQEADDGLQADGWKAGIGRDIAYGGRSVLQGAGSLLGAIGGDAFNAYVVDPARKAMHKPSVADVVAGRDGFVPSRSYRDEAAALADRIGLPKAQTSGDRILGDVGEALTGTGLTMGIGGGLNALANLGRGGAAAGQAGYAAPAGNRLADFLTAQPVLQGVSAATGSGAASAVRESGGSQGQQLAAGLLGGLGPGVAGATGSAAVRGAVRGTSGAQMQRTIDDFAQLGATPSVGQASGNRLVQGAENILAGGPTSAGVMGRFVERQADDIGSGLQQRAESLHRSASAEKAGRSIQRGVETFDNNVGAMRRALYWEADRHIPASSGTPMRNTVQALTAMTTPNPGALDTTSRMVNPALRQRLADLTSDLQAGGGTIPYEALRKIRTSVGEQMNDFSMTPDTPASQLRGLYAALSRDMEEVAKAAGPAAERAAKRANNYTKMSSARLESLQRVVDKAGGGEAVYNAVMAGSKDGGTRLREVMQSLPKQSQQSLTAAVIKRMGLPTPGQAGLEDTFSAATFLSNWKGVSAEARRALFDRHGPQFSADMDRVARVAANIKSGSKVFANPSGTANRAAAQSYAIGLPLSIAQAPFTGHYWPIVTTIGGGVAANIAARRLTNPRFVHWLARATERPDGALMGTVNAIRAEGRARDDQDLLDLAGELEKPVNHRPNGNQGQ